ncbi:MAG: phage major capsid protein [Sphingomonadales bacterium]|nr:phage major capsid protein [Sphingomonadaceae bacterium]MBS3929600.1 phage major capsid protein [Sphingomonadales bacterium]
MSDVKELRGKLANRRDTLKTVLEQSKTDDPLVRDFAKVEFFKSSDDTGRVAEFKALNDEIDDLCKQLEPFEAADAEVKRAQRAAESLSEVEGHPGHVTPGAKARTADAPVKSLGEMIWETSGKKALRMGGESIEIDMDIKAMQKTLFETGAGWDSEVTRTGRVVDYATRPIQVTDLIPTTTTNQSAVKYMEETTFTNNAAEVAEAGTYGEAALALTERTSPVEKIGVWLPVTDEQLEDVGQANSYISRRLPFMVQQRLDGQILVGDGTSPNLSGFLDVSGTQTQAKGSDPTPDAVYKAMDKVLVTGRATPGAAVFHPNDWQPVRLLRTADGVYIWGSPSDAGPARIWGISVTLSDAITENTALVGDFAQFSELSIRRGIEMKVTDSHSDYFIKGKQAIRADIRCAFVVYRPAAFCTVTGL